MDVKIVNKSGFDLPQYETEGSAGMDVRTTEEITLGSMGRTIAKTGLYVELPKGKELQVRPRSGMAIKKGVTVLNAPGTVDSDYRGEVGVILINLSDEPVTIEKGERIAQFVFTDYERANLITVQKLSETARGNGGFGSTGKK